MTTTALDRAALDRDAFVAAADRRATRAVATNIVGGTWWVGAAFWLIYAAVLAVQAAVAIASDVPEIRSASGTHTAPWVFLFIMGIVLLAQVSRLHVVAGGTRRSLLRGERWASVALGVTVGVGGWLLLLAVDAVVRALGHDVRPLEGALVTDGAGVWLALLVHVLASGVLFATGVLVGHAYRRVGGWLGTLALPLTLLPAAAALAAFEVAGRDGVLVPDVPAWLVVLGGGVAAWALAAWGTWWVVKDAPVA